MRLNEQRNKMDAENFCRLIHSKLAVTTSTGNYEGVLKFISVSRQRVTFEHVYELPSREYFGTMDLLLSSILSWKVLQSVEENFDISNFDSSEDILIGEFSKNERIDYLEVTNVALEKHFVEYLPTNLKNKCPFDFCIIDSIDADFYKAVKHLSESSIIGASFHGPKISRSGILTWLCLSTSSCVFLFDIQRLGQPAFKEGFKKILEDEHIEKVIHDCREVADCLLHLFNTELKSVFDTQVADYVINMQMCTGKKVFKYVNSLDSCLFKYLKVPQNFLYNRNKSVFIVDELKFYEKRPISKDFTNVLLKSSMYLLFLKEEQEKLLLSPYEQAMELNLNTLRSASDAEAHMMLTEDSTPHYLLESVKPVSFCDIPQPTVDSLKQLKEIVYGQNNMSVAERRRYASKILQKLGTNVTVDEL